MEPEEENDDFDMFCPALPPHLQDKQKEERILGPALPTNFDPTLLPVPKENSLPKTEEESSSNSESEDETDLIGPILPNNKQDKRFDEEQLAYRAYYLNHEKDEKVLERETWMTELPSEKSKIMSLGLGTRQFRKKNPDKPGDRSIWTDTPADIERKAKLGLDSKPEEKEDETIQDVALKERDEKITDLVEKFTAEKRSAPLIESHGKKRAKEKESSIGARRPFSREEDLSVNKFDEAQKETILKKARLLNDRFSAGNRKYL